METPRELSLTDLEDELERVKKCREETDKFLKDYNSLHPDTKTRIEELKRELELLKKFANKESKENFSIVLKKRESDIGKAIKYMKKSKDKIYDPSKVKW